MHVEARYRQALEKATLHKVEAGLFESFEKKQAAIQERQFIA
ncbi:MAG: tRNA-specific 2-thiouridylase [Polaribacter sp.]|jgi:tRNA-specific 2-thiouridylase